jgi:hypothetical protein
MRALHADHAKRRQIHPAAFVASLALVAQTLCACRVTIGNEPRGRRGSQGAQTKHERLIRLASPTISRVQQSWLRRRSVRRRQKLYFTNVKERGMIMTAKMTDLDRLALDHCWTFTTSVTTAVFEKLSLTMHQGTSAPHLQGAQPHRRLLGDGHDNISRTCLRAINAAREC